MPPRTTTTAKNAPVKAPAKVAPAKKAAAKKAPAKTAAAKTAATKTAAAKTAATKAAAAKKALAKKAPSKAAPAKKAAAPVKPVKAAPAKKAPGKKAPAKSAAAAKKAAPAAKAPANAAPAKKAPAKASVKPVKQQPVPSFARRAMAAPRGPVTPAPAVHAAIPRALRDIYAAHHEALAPIWDPATGLTVALKVPASVSLYPTRKRCKGCNHGLGAEAILRMFCTYACAGLPNPDFNPTTAPRQCKRAARSDEAGEWAFKQRFTTAEAAEGYLRPGTTLYRCSNCFFLHIGNVSAPPSGGIPDAPTSGRGPFEDAVLALLHTRGISGAPSPAQVAAAKRDARAVIDALRKHAGPGGSVRLPAVPTR